MVTALQCTEYVYLLYYYHGKILCSVTKNASSSSKALNMLIWLVDKNKNAPYTVNKQLYIKGLKSLLT